MRRVRLVPLGVLVGLCSGAILAVSPARTATPALAATASAVETPPAPPPEPEPSSVARELTRTDYAIRRARARVSRSGNEAAIQGLAEAVRLQSEARSTFAENLFARAGRLASEARARARDALVLVGPAAEDPAYVARALKQAEQALGMAGDVLRDDPRSHCTERLASLNPLLDSARVHRKRGELRACYAQSRAVRDSVLELLRICPPRLSERDARRCIDRARATLDWTRDEVGDHPKPRAARLLRNAEEHLQKADSSLERDGYRDVLLHAKIAEQIMEEALSAQRENGSGRAQRKRG